MQRYHGLIERGVWGNGGGGSKGAIDICSNNNVIKYISHSLFIIKALIVDRRKLGYSRLVWLGIHLDGLYERLFAADYKRGVVFRLVFYSITLGRGVFMVINIHK